MSSLLPTQRALTASELDAVLAPLGRVRAHRPLAGGTFSAVEAVTLADGDTVVVKASVPDAAAPGDRARLLAYEHDLLRSERDLLTALATVPEVPAPQLLLADFTRTHVEVDVVVMSFLPGVPWDRGAASMTPEANARAFSQVGEAIAAIATVRGDRFGLPADGFRLGDGTWAGFMRRLIEATVDDAHHWGVDVHPDRLLAAWETAGPALAEVTVPALVHTDLWHGNVLVDPTTGDVTGVVDFERSLFGDPLWGLAGGETHSAGPFEPAKVHGYERATGCPLVMNEAARRRTALYRLWSMAIQMIEIEPRGFTGDWVEEHRASIRANRDRLYSVLDV